MSFPLMASARDLKRDAWQAIGRELLRLGLVECAPGKICDIVADTSRVARRCETAHRSC